MVKVDSLPVTDAEGWIGDYRIKAASVDGCHAPGITTAQGNAIVVTGAGNVAPGAGKGSRVVVAAEQAQVRVQIGRLEQDGSRAAERIEQGGRFIADAGEMEQGVGDVGFERRDWSQASRYAFAQGLTTQLDADYAGVVDDIGTDIDFIVFQVDGASVARQKGTPGKALNVHAGEGVCAAAFGGYPEGGGSIQFGDAALPEYAVDASDLRTGSGWGIFAVIPSVAGGVCKRFDGRGLIRQIKTIQQAQNVMDRPQL